MEPYAREFAFSVSHTKAGGFGTHRRRVILLSRLTWARQAGGPAGVRSIWRKKKHRLSRPRADSPWEPPVSIITQPLERGLFCSQARKAQEDLAQLDTELARGVEAEKAFNAALCSGCADRRRPMESCSLPKAPVPFPASLAHHSQHVPL